MEQHFLASFASHDFWWLGHLSPFLTSMGLCCCLAETWDHILHMCRHALEKPARDTEPVSLKVSHTAVNQKEQQYSKGMISTDGRLFGASLLYLYHCVCRHAGAHILYKSIHMGVYKVWIHVKRLFERQSYGELGGMGIVIPAH